MVTKTIIFKVLLEKEFKSLRSGQPSKGSEIDQKDGYIHFSSKEQLRETVRKHFPKKKDLVLMAVETKSLGSKLVWEKAREGKLFPHYYGEINFDNGIWFAPLPFNGSEHIFPSGL